MSDASEEGMTRHVPEGQVLEALRRAPTEEVAQPDLIRETGLARGTVVSIVRKLEEKRLIDTYEGESGPDGGRPAKVIRLRKDAAFSLGVHFGHRHVRVSAGNLRDYQVFFRELPVGSSNEAEFDVGSNAHTSLRFAVDLIQAAIAHNESEGRGLDKLMAVTVGWSAPVQDWRAGDVVIDDSMRTWLGIRRPADKLKELLDLDVDVDFWTENHANLAALMELEHGVGQEHDDFLYLHWGAGVGGSFVSRGVRQMGGSRIAGEIGHIPLPDAGKAPEPCKRCGLYHCLEALAGGAAIVRKVTGGRDSNLRDVIAMAQAGDEKAQHALESAARLVARAVGPIVTFNNPTAIVIGGEFGREYPQSGEVDGVRRSRNGNPYDLIEEAFRSGLQEYTSVRALNAVLEMNSSRWRYGAVQGAAAFATRKALEKRYADDASRNDTARRSSRLTAIP
jgi:predicted NBD/HSP70 family sugar kinase